MFSLSYVQVHQVRPKCASSGGVRTGNIINKVSAETIYDGSGSQKAQTQYEYDTTSVISTSGSPAPSHDYTNFNNLFATRGNATRVKRWRNTDGALVSTTYNYDDLGNLRSIADPLTHTTSWSYADSWGQASCPPSSGNGQAYLTSVTNHLGHNVQFTRASCTGQIWTKKDQNDINNSRPGTQFGYDLLNRPVSTTLPDGGQTTVSYNDSLGSLYVRTQRKLDATRWADSYNYFDGLGRSTQTRIVDPLGDSYVDTTYDELGRVASVTNPYRAPTDSTYGVTSTTYDALGRVTRVTNPDASFLDTSYTGNCTTVTDETSRQKKSCVDALGLLTQVTEPDPTSGALTYETNYSYDTLGNLLCVEQKGNLASSGPTCANGQTGGNWRVRRFTFNSLSQLLSANNPESGLISYTYDNDGNVTTKSAGGIVTTHTYDALHRLTDKTYSNSDPAVALRYDLSSAWGNTLTNTIGRLAQTTVGTGSGIAASIYKYDAMGRITYNSECAPSNCGSGSYPKTATYDFAGNLASLTYPSGRKVTFGVDNANRLNNVTYASFSGTTVNYNYWSVPATVTANPGFHPNGTPRYQNFGNSLQQWQDLDSRLHPTGTSLYSAQRNFIWKQLQYQSNGNVATILDNLDAGRTQTFTYDKMNRLLTAQSTASTGADAWGQSFTIDPWGNLTAQTVTKGTVTTFSNAVNNNNQLVGLSYDTAGNQLADGINGYTYDGENRLKAVNVTGATYTYNALGDRVRKQSGSNWTEYIYFGSTIVAEKNQAGDWSDYVFAGSQRIARADNYEDKLRTSGTNCSACGSQYTLFAFPNAGGLLNYVVQSGDYLYLRQYQSTGARGGMVINFTDSTTTNWTAKDQDGYNLNDLPVQSAWKARIVDLGTFAGKTISKVSLVTESSTAAGNWTIDYTDIALVGADGNVHSLYNRESAAPGFTISGTTGVTNRAYQVQHVTGVTQADGTTTFYHGDHLGSSRMTSSSNPWPTWEGTFLPYGAEFNLNSTTNHYKFTGKERDAESGLDYFRARYYSSRMGRFLSPDWNDHPEPIPYASLSDPQTLNLYAFVTGNPIAAVDKSGHGGKWTNIGGKVMMRVDASSADQVNVHVKDGNTPEVRGRLNPETKQIEWTIGQPSAKIADKVQDWLLARNKYDIAKAKQEMSYLGGTRGESATETTTSKLGRATNNALALMNLVSIVTDSYIHYRMNKLEGTTGFHLAIDGSVIVTNLQKFGDTMGTGATIGFQGQSFVLGEDGSWKDVTGSGSELIQNTDGTFQIRLAGA